MLLLSRKHPSHHLPPIIACVVALNGAACTGTESDEVYVGTEPSDDTTAVAVDELQPLEWTSVTPVSQPNPDVIAERVTYLVRERGDHGPLLTIQGLVCRPAAAGRFPVVVWNHGGFDGYGPEAETPVSICHIFASQGYVVLESAYRGEGGSEGQIEVCLGEVDDVLRMTKIGRSMPYADSDRVAMGGVSHGGCITLRALQRGVSVEAAADLLGPTDWAADFARWEDELANGPPELQPVYQYLIDVLTTAVGGTPATDPEAYRERSPLYFKKDLKKSSAAVLMQHGTGDELIRVEDTCELANQTGKFTAYHVAVTDAGITETTVPPPQCEDDKKLDWRVPVPRGDWDGRRHVVIYDGVTHFFSGAAGPLLLSDFFDFIATRFPPN